jgi:predicted DNA-binding transcriptional regulator YafY
MKRSSANRRRPSVHITLGRAARLHRLVMYLAQAAQSRDAILAELRIGLRTFYRELELLKRCGVRIRQKDKAYALLATAEEAEGRLPFPDPQLSFAEMAELARGSGPAAQRLAEMLQSVINYPVAAKGAKERGRRSAKSKAKQ